MLVHIGPPLITWFGCVGNYIGRYAANKRGSDQPTDQPADIPLSVSVSVSEKESLIALAPYRFIDPCNTRHTAVTWLHGIVAAMERWNGGPRPVIHNRPMHNAIKRIVGIDGLYVCMCVYVYSTVLSQDHPRACMVDNHILCKLHGNDLMYTKLLRVSYCRRYEQVYDIVHEARYE